MKTIIEDIKKEGFDIHLQEKRKYNYITLNIISPEEYSIFFQFKIKKNKERIEQIEELRYEIYKIVSKFQHKKEIKLWEQQSKYRSRKEMIKDMDAVRMMVHTLLFLLGDLVDKEREQEEKEKIRET